jgi:hypothetical protein
MLIRQFTGDLATAVAQVAPMELKEVIYANITSPKRQRKLIIARIAAGCLLRRRG